MYLFSKYGLAFHLALVAALAFFAPCFAAGTPSAIAVLCLCAIAVEWMAAEPSVRTGETRREARARTFGGIVRDPLFWIGLLAVAISLSRWINSGIETVYSVGAGKWELEGPPWPDAPCALDAATGGTAFATILSLVTVTLAIRHALGAKARAAFGVSLAFCGGIAGWCALCLAAAGNPAAVAMAKADIVDSVCAGLPFGTCLAAGAMAATAAEEYGWRTAVFMAGAGLSGCAAALAVFCPPLVAIVFFSAAAVVFLLAVFRSGAVVSLVGALRTFMAAALAFAGLFVGLLAVPDIASAKAAQCAEMSPESLAERRTAVSELASGLWKGGRSRWIGAGTRTFGVRAREYVGSLPTRKEKRKFWKRLPLDIASTRPSNFFSGFNAEHGMIGVMAALAWVFVLAFDWFKRLAVALGSYARGADDPPAVLAFPMICWGALPIAALTVFAGFCSMEAECANLLPVSAAMALSAASFPKSGAAKRKRKQKPKAEAEAKGESAGEAETVPGAGAAGGVNGDLKRKDDENGR